MCDLTELVVLLKREDLDTTEGIKESKEFPLYHEDVRTFEVSETDTGDFIGLFYTDFFPRASKSGGAWQNNFMDQGLFKGEVRRPHAAIVCNFTKPTESKPSLLTLDEVLTLFHEFGHALHSLLSKCKYVTLAGTNVYWDFVELPSKIMENWVMEKEGLDVFAEHYETGKKIPQDIRASVGFRITHKSATLIESQNATGLANLGAEKLQRGEVIMVDPSSRVTRLVVAKADIEDIAKLLPKQALEEPVTHEKTEKTLFDEILEEWKQAEEASARGLQAPPAWLLARAFAYQQTNKKPPSHKLMDTWHTKRHGKGMTKTRRDMVRRACKRLADGLS